MKILVAGAAWHDNILNVISFGFSELGHETALFNDVIRNKSLVRAKIAKKLPFPRLAERYDRRYRGSVGRQFIEKVREYKPELVFVVNGITFLPETVKYVRETLKVPVFAYIIDDPLLGKTWLYDLSSYSRLFVIDESWMGYLEFFTPGRVHYLPQVADHKTFHPLNVDKTNDIVFGGTLSLRLPNAPSGFLRAQILNVLAERKYKIKAFAPGISETFGYYPALRNIDYSDKYENHGELNKLYNSAKITVSIHSPQFKSGISPRVFEAAFARSFQLVEYKDDVSKLFPEGIKTFSSPKELIDLVEYYLPRGEEREAMAEKAFRHALEFHTWKSRAGQVLPFLGKI
jgi:spore maturation protein CgeB